MKNPTFGIPTPTLPLTDPKSGLIASTWYQLITRLAQLTAERSFESVAVGASPFVYEAYTIGNIFITGGTVSSITLTRGGISLTVPTNRFIPVAANDIVTVTHTGAPTMTFVPSARA